MTDLLKEKFLSTIDEVLKNPLMPPQRELLEGLRKTFLTLAEDEKKAEPTNPAHRLDCSLAVNFLPEKMRMCRAHPDCEGCPINDKCEDLEFSISPEIVNIVQAWSDENPPKQIKTILDDFKEKHPNAKFDLINNFPVCRPCDLGYIVPENLIWAGSLCKKDCSKCWNAPLMPLVPLKEGE